MSIFQGFYQLIFGPLELLFEFIYGIAYSIVGNVGNAIIPLSLCMNFLALPFYNRADAIQQEELEREKRMASDVEHIKEVFKADERYMMLRAYYRLKSYHPVYALRSFLPLILEIPFFVAAYHFLSNFLVQHGVEYGPFANLGTPDKLLSIGGVSINLLPILMTLINILSISIYSKNRSTKGKIQLYGVAAIFLVLLYNSPSGLVFYWTLNQVFSLAKNIVSSAKNRSFVAYSIFSVLGAVLLVYAIAFDRKYDLNQLFMIVLGVLCQIPMIKTIMGKKWTEKKIEDTAKPTSLSFILGCLFMTILTGVLIPSAVIGYSPAEFTVIAQYQSPLLYILNSFLLAAGTFLVWLGLFYYLADKKFKRIMSAAIWGLSVISIVNYMFFGTNLGNLSAELKYDMGVSFSTGAVLVNIEMMLLISTLLYIVWIKKKRIVHTLLSIFVIAVFGMSVYNLTVIIRKLPQIKISLEQSGGEKPSFTLSRSGKNVIVFMLDRGISSYIPYFMQENPDLLRQFDGFTWYPNTLSYGTRTNTASPALFGGYEYTPEKINNRKTKKLVEKQNEALKLMPHLFDKAGFEVTVCDPPYAGYTWIPDLSIFEEYPNIRAFNTGNGQLRDQSGTLESKQQIWRRNLFCYSIMKILPLILQPEVYQGGTYYNPYTLGSVIRQKQHTKGSSVSFGVRNDFMDAFAALSSLSDMTQVSEEKKDTFLMMSNDTAHNIMLLQEPQYKPELFVDNTRYDADHQERFTFNGQTMSVDTVYKMSHYQSNMASIIQLGKWLDYMREQGVYNNTRIIIAADHGWPLEQFRDMIFSKKPNDVIYNPGDVMAYNPLLIVKDFDATGFTVNSQFMTNADVPLLAFQDLIQDPVNPFTGNSITATAKGNKEQHVFYTDLWGTDVNNGNAFLPGFWFSVKNGNIFDLKNWSYLGFY